MTSQRIKDTVSLTYKALTSEGKTVTRTITINKLNLGATNEKIFEAALMLRSLMAYANDKIIKKTEDLLLED